MQTIDAHLRSASLRREKHRPVTTWNSGGQIYLWDDLWMPTEKRSTDGRIHRREAEMGMSEGIWRLATEFLGEAVSRSGPKSSAEAVSVPVVCRVLIPEVNKG